MFVFKTNWNIKNQQWNLNIWVSQKIYHLKENLRQAHYCPFSIVWKFSLPGTWEGFPNTRTFWGWKKNTCQMLYTDLYKHINIHNKIAFEFTLSLYDWWPGRWVFPKSVSLVNAACDLGPAACSDSGSGVWKQDPHCTVLVCFAQFLP